MKTVAVAVAVASLLTIPTAAHGKLPGPWRPCNTAVPDVLGTEWHQAEQVLQDAGFAVKTNMAKDGSGLVWTVDLSEPVAGTVVNLCATPQAVVEIWIGS